MPAIEVSHVTKEYRLGALQSLKQSLANTGARLMGRPVVQPPLFKALDNVSFSIEPGEVVGIIGHNGAGKSTLLKMLARISTPTSGSVKVNGRVAPLIEVGAGFVGDFTGRENVYLNGAILGMSKKEIDRKFDEIVDFAEMAEFIDTPVKRYSSGMQVKLAFAVATSIEAEILIVDEVLAVGDLAFQRKCFDRMEDLIKRQGRTVLLVSHNIRQVERIASRVLMLERGAVLFDGDPRSVCNAFYEKNDLKIRAGAMSRKSQTLKTGHVELIKAEILDDKNKVTENISRNSGMTVRLNIRVDQKLTAPSFGIGIHTVDFIYLATAISEESVSIEKLDCGEHCVTLTIPKVPLLPGVYALRFGINEGKVTAPVYYGESILNFQVLNTQSFRSEAMQEGFVELPGVWRISTNAFRSLAI